MICIERDRCKSSLKNCRAHVFAADQRLHLCEEMQPLIVPVGKLPPTCSHPVGQIDSAFEDILHVLCLDFLLSEQIPFIWV